MKIQYGFTKIEFKEDATDVNVHLRTRFISRIRFLKNHSSPNYCLSYFSALAAQYCYFDHGISYEDWTGDKNDFSELFSELASPPEIVQFKNFGYFLTILRTDDEIIVTFPGTRKNIHGLKDLGESLKMSHFTECIF